jgi:hypothetical protein
MPTRPIITTCIANLMRHCHPSIEHQEEISDPLKKNKKISDENRSLFL